MDHQGCGYSIFYSQLTAGSVADEQKKRRAALLLLLSLLPAMCFFSSLLSFFFFGFRAAHARDSEC
jgi:hypothetical protein